MDKDRVILILEQQAEACMELSGKLKTNGLDLITSVEKRLVRIATLPRIQEAYASGLTTYLIDGGIDELLSGVADSAH